jgi:hypothetical protein
MSHLVPLREPSQTREFKKTGFLQPFFKKFLAIQQCERSC